MFSLKRFVKNTRGQAIVEMALLLPLIFLILAGIIEFSLMMNSYLTISHAAREGARLGTVGSTDQEIVDKVNEVASFLDPNNITVVISPQQSERMSGESITVEVQYEFPIVIPIISDIVGEKVALKSSITMRIE
jgi:Flp pilus assembly protein TadG